MPSWRLTQKKNAGQTGHQESYPVEEPTCLFAGCAAVEEGGLVFPFRIIYGTGAAEDFQEFSGRFCAVDGFCDAATSCRALRLRMPNACRT